MAVDAPTAAQAGLGRAGRRVGAAALFVALPLALAALVAVVGGLHALGFDYHGGLWQAGKDILAGRSPYRPGALDGMLNRVRAGGHAPTVVELPVYPPPVLLALTPLALLPAGLANAAFVALLLPVPAAALYMCGVRDPRCYGVAYLSAPVLLGIEIGTLSPLLLLGVVALWRWRDRALAAGGLVAAMVCAKLFLWPLAVWLAVTGRLRAAAIAASGAAAACLLGWAAIGFAGLRSYPHMLSTLSALEQSQGYSLIAALIRLGLPAGAARAAAVAAGLVLLVAVARMARGADGDRRSLCLAVVAALVLSPIVWLHYLTLLTALIAITWRRFSWPWLLPALLWLTPSEQSLAHPLGIAVAIAVAAAVTLAAIRATQPDGGTARFSS